MIQAKIYARRNSLSWIDSVSFQVIEAHIFLQDECAWISLSMHSSASEWWWFYS